MSSDASDAKRIFLEAVENYEPQQWPEFLDTACGAQFALRERVELLLEAHRESNRMLDGTGIMSTVGMPPLSEAPGTVVGPYKLLEEIGEGGFGVVYMAEQQRPVRRKVALKIIKPGMDTRQVIARFEAERQALALMDHPNIARVFDADATESGRPYFVMELIRGLPITEYCDRSRLSTNQRLNLFVQVCQAVQHAHQKGIIHRDIKPTNMLVTLHDGTPVPKIIDFGVAKAINQRLTERTLFTGYSQMLGTPLYMSPEQAEFSGLDVDTRTDIYSLGVLLYELLTGTTPFEKERLSEAGYDELRRIIREEEPPSPSARLSTLEAVSLTTIAAERQVEPSRLAQLVRGDLDWIVMKALEKDRGRRYETASALAADVQRYLHDEPIEARPPSRVYRLRKFARRYRAAVLVGAVVFLTLIGGIVGTSAGLIRAWDAEADARRDAGRAEAAEQVAEDRSADAQRAAAQAKANAQEADAERQRAESNVQTALQALEEVYLQLAAEELPQKSEIEDRDRRFLEKSLEFYRNFANQRGEDPQTRQAMAKAHLRVGDIYAQLDGWTYGGPEREQAYAEAGALAQRLVADFPSEPEYRYLLAAAHSRLAQVYQARGEKEPSEHTYRRALADFEKLAAENFKPTWYPHMPADSYRELAVLLADDGQAEQAEQAYRKARAVWDNLVAEQPDSRWYREQRAYVLRLMANLFAGTGDTEQADEFYGAAGEEYEELSERFPESPGHRLSLAGQNREQANLLKNAGKPKEAEAVYQQSIAAYRKLVEEFPSNRNFRVQLAVSLRAAGNLFKDTRRRNKALQSYRESQQLLEDVLEWWPNAQNYRQQLAWTLRNYGNVLGRTKRHEETESVYRRYVALAEQLLNDDPGNAEYRGQLIEALWGVAAALTKAQRYDEAHAVFSRRTSLLEQALADEPESFPFRKLLAQARVAEGDLLQLTGRHEEAAELWRRGMDGLPSPAADYKLRITTPGLYRFFLRSGGINANGDSLYVRVLELSDGPQGEIADWYCFYAGGAASDFATNGWRTMGGFEEANSGWGGPAAWRISKPGNYTLRLMMREDGTAVDAFVLQLAELPPPAESGPAESQQAEDGAFLEADGQLVVEAEHFSSRSEVRGDTWRVVPQEDPGKMRKNGFRGNGYVQVLPEGNGFGYVAFNRLTLPTEQRRAWKLEQATRAIETLPDAADSWGARGNLYRSQSELDKAAADFDRYVALGPGNAGELNLLAWRLAAAPGLKPDHAKRAVAMAAKAVELVPADSSFWNTRGVAHYRARQWRQAIDALRFSSEIGRGWSFRYDALFTAMAHWQLGEKEQAARWYRAAVRWIETKGSNAELRRFRSEAQALMRPLVYDGWRRREPPPRDASLWHQYVLGHRVLGGPEGYARACARLVERFGKTEDPEIAGLLAWVCTLAPDSGVDAGQAIVWAEQCLAANPSRAVDLYKVGVAHYRAGHDAQAVEWLDKAVAARGNGALAWDSLVLAMAHHLLGHTEQAQQHLAQARNWLDAPRAGLNEERRLDLTLLRHEAHVLLGVPDEPSAQAIREISEFAKGLGPSPAAAKVSEEVDEVALYTRVLEADPDAGWAYVERGDAYAAVKQPEKADADYAKAVEVYGSALEQRPDGWELHFGRCRAHTRLRQFEQAAAAASEAIKRQADLWWLHDWRGNADAELERWDKAAADYAQVVASPGGDYLYWYRLALVRLAAGDADGYRDACQAMQQRFADSADADILNFTAWTHALAPAAPGELDAAVAAGEKAVASDPKSASHQQTLGAVLFRAGRFEEGLEHLMEAERIAQGTEVVKVSPAYTWFFLAMTHYAEGRYDEAEDWHDKAVQWTDKVMQQHDDGTARLLWNRRLTLALLRAEAEKVMGAGGGNRPKAKSAGEVQTTNASD